MSGVITATWITVDYRIDISREPICRTGRNNWTTSTVISGVAGRSGKLRLW